MATKAKGTKKKEVRCEEAEEICDQKGSFEKND
jgi:hypothetical protein